jgi:uncharacterized DUF497 family protein
MKWVKDPKIEANLRALGIQFDTEQVLLNNIDREESMRRQVRLQGRLVDEWVLEMAEAMEKPEAAFPMPILQKWRKGVYFIWSGNHRIGAAELVNLETVDAYVITITDPRMMDILPRVVNSWEGHGLSRDERIINARFLIEKHGITAADAAKMFGLKAEAIWVSKRIDEAKTRIHAHGIDTKTFSKSLLSKFATLNNDNVISAAARIINDHEVKGLEAMNIIDDIRSKNTELQQLAEVARWEKVFIDRKNPKNTPKLPYRQTKRSTFLGLLTRMDKFLQDHKTLTQAQIVDIEDISVVRKRCRNIVATLKGFLDESN